MISRRDAIALAVLLTILTAAPAVAGSLPSCGPWERIASPTAEVQWGMTHGDGLFVSVGENGSILTSPDGFAWSERDGLGELLFDVVWNPSAGAGAGPRVLGGGTAKVLAWYDNEWGYAARLLDFAAHVAERGV